MQNVRNLVFIIHNLYLAQLKPMQVVMANLFIFVLRLTHLNFSEICLVKSCYFRF